MGNRRDNVFIVLSAAAAAACLAGALLIRSMNSGLVGVFQGEGWGAQSPLIVAAMVKGLTHGGVILGFVAVIGFLGLKRKVFRRHSILLRILLCGVLAADLAWVSSRYVKGYNSDAVYRSNILIETLQSDPEPFRLKLLTRGGLYDYWLGTVFPYYGIQRLDLVAAARLPELELKFFGAFNDNPERLWQLANVRYLFGDVRAASSMLRDPARAGAFEPVLAFNVARDGEGLAIVPAQKGQSPAHVLLRYKNALPRAALFHSWRTVGTDDEGLQILADKALDPHAAVLVSTGEPGVDIPAAPQDGGGRCETVEVVSYEAVAVSLRLPPVEQPSILLLNDRYDPRWRVTVDGRDAPLLRCNVIMRGVLVPPGAREVEFAYKPGLGYTVLSLGVALVVVGWGMGTLVHHRHKRITDQR